MQPHLGERVIVKKESERVDILNSFFRLILRRSALGLLGTLARRSQVVLNPFSTLSHHSIHADSIPICRTTGPESLLTASSFRDRQAVLPPTSTMTRGPQWQLLHHRKENPAKFAVIVHDLRSLVSPGCYKPGS